MRLIINLYLQNKVTDRLANCKINDNISIDENPHKSSGFLKKVRQVHQKK